MNLQYTGWFTLEWEENHKTFGRRDVDAIKLIRKFRKKSREKKNQPNIFVTEKNIRTFSPKIKNKE